MRRIPVRSSVLLALLAGLLLAGCGDVDRQESLTVSHESFTSADGNIGCIADENQVRCDIREKDWRATPDPRCQLDYGNGLMVADGQAEVVCAGDTALNSGPELAHGNINMVGSFECTTTEAGDTIRCENLTTGNGFELSRDQYELF